MESSRPTTNRSSRWPARTFLLRTIILSLSLFFSSLISLLPIYISIFLSLSAQSSFYSSAYSCVFVLERKVFTIFFLNNNRLVPFLLGGDGSFAVFVLIIVASSFPESARATIYDEYFLFSIVRVSVRKNPLARMKLPALVNYRTNTHPAAGLKVCRRGFKTTGAWWMAGGGRR